MSIEVLTADSNGAESLQQWAAMGLPVPPSWRIFRCIQEELGAEQLVAQLRALPRMFAADRYWVLQQGPMNAQSRRESLLNLDSDEALAAALQSIFSRSDVEQVVIQALPRQRAAGVLFTRHPLRQDLDHMVVEGVVGQQEHRQRLIYDRDGLLVHSSEEDQHPDALQQQITAEQFLHLKQQLGKHFQRPQAAEWVFDGRRLWLLQTLPTGSLPEPKQAWSRRACPELFNQAVTPLWYTLLGRWLKTAYWQPLVRRQGLAELDKVEPYRRQHSHIYTNCAFFRSLAPRYQALVSYLPPAWQHQHVDSGRSPGNGRSYRRRLALQRLSVALRGWQLRDYSRDGLWQALMRLDRLGERLAAQIGPLCYQQQPTALDQLREPLPLTQLCSGEELTLLAAVLSGDSARINRSGLRPGDDPVHVPLSASPPQSTPLQDLPIEPQRLQKLQVALIELPASPLLVQRRQLRILRFALANRYREVLTAMASLLLKDGLLQHLDDIYFYYFDELWPLWMQGKTPPRVTAEVLAERKLRYLEDAHQGAPDWMMDQVGYGFGGGQQSAPLLRGHMLVPGQVSGTLKRLCSAWGLNQIMPGDIVVVDQVEPAWLPWLAQAAGLVIADRHCSNPAASLARAAGIPAIWGVCDVMHSVKDGMQANLNASKGQLIVNS